ncbi:hypothetical protein F5887DRAFT_1085329 [Amanita rubescens]|nr:hypothetical protein F5887DRAFT_1085329 [Amanita rubescens]
MRLTFIALAFFFINVLATPINPSRGNAVALRRRSPNERDTPGKVAAPKARTSTPKGGNDSTMKKAAAKCKRATPNELIEALRIFDGQNPLLSEAGCSVYRLKEKVDNENVIVKVILNGMRSKKTIVDEAWALHNVEQLLGWAHTPNGRLYYLFIKDMGVPLSPQMPFAKDPQQLRELQLKAEKVYHSQYHLEHDDHNESPANWVFRQEAGGEWRAELIDWEFFKRESGHKDYKDPPAPFIIDPDCVFVPPKMERYLGTK